MTPWKWKTGLFLTCFSQDSKHRSVGEETPLSITQHTLTTAHKPKCHDYPKVGSTSPYNTLNKKHS